MSKKQKNVEPIRYTLEQILKSKKYSNVEKDIIRAKGVLKEYSLEEIDSMIYDFKKGKVK